jgi:hypothetical protein
LIFNFNIESLLEIKKQKLLDQLPDLLEKNGNQNADENDKKEEKEIDLTDIVGMQIH